MLLQTSHRDLLDTKVVYTSCHGRLALNRLARETRDRAAQGIGGGTERGKHWLRGTGLGWSTESILRKRENLETNFTEA